MASKVEALVRNFLRTDADSLCLVVGERLYIRRGDAKSIVGREALSDASFRAIADELSPGDLMESLIDTGFTAEYRPDDDLDPVAIQFGSIDGRPSMTVVRTVPLPRPAAPEVSDPTLERAAGPAPPQPQPRTARHGIVGAHGSAEAEALSVPSLSSSGDGASAGPGSARAGRAVPPTPSTSAALVSERPLDRILVRMLAAEASDLHLSAGATPCFRVHGEMTPQSEMGILSSDDIERLLESILPDKYRKEFAERNDTDLAYEIEGVSRFRVNVFRDRRGVGAVLRQIPIEILTAEQLNLPPAVVQLGELHKGLVLVTGPTGSGKSTTLAALVDHVNATRTDHIITIEDPIEFVHPNKKCLVNQREIGGHTRGFKEALRAALREDPDMVLVGEMRDLETVAIAIETAETGHLVFGTLHTTTAPGTVDRLINQFPEDRQAQIRIMLADSLRAVVSQTLLKKKGGGRVAALEILISNNAVANLIRDAKTFQLPSIMQTGRGQGMQLLNDSLLDLVRRDVVEPREAFLKSMDRPGLLSAFKAMNLPGIAELTRDVSSVTAMAGAAPPSAPAPASAGR